MRMFVRFSCNFPSEGLLLSYERHTKVMNIRRIIRLADDRKAALDAALKKIEKNYGKGAIMKLGEKVDQQISTIPSGSLALDVALGVGGYHEDGS